MSVSTPRSPHRRERGVSDRLGQTNQVDATAYRWLSIMRGGHSSVTQFRNQEDTGGHERTRRARRLSTGGHGRNRRDTEGHTVVPVRDREAPGSNPGPPTNFVFKIGVSEGSLEPPDHSRVTDSSGAKQPRRRVGECCQPTSNQAMPLLEGSPEEKSLAAMEWLFPERRSVFQVPMK
jgi:hypothetical protein